ncbi:hypothetical protein GRF29_8g1020309 [Pseudopithomyces chartarum]|uniref:Zn(2)-C6 fungal-type domain-containing protein n=1 Tax=Pseudopithomyces chartarum TaxID=1892770 RepID=A0AAN6M3M0_9PLEO|nr:hypothetical protein GRF29_8g1020309 [Pseudopithomyces chartarum]
MAALVASPLATPLGSPRCTPDFQKGPSETAALVDGLLTAWAEQESRSLSVPNLTNFNEPTSYPFPIILDHVSTPEIDSTVPLAADFSSYTSHDFDVLFGDFDQTQQSIEYGNDAIHDNWTVPNPPDDILITADALHLEDEFWGSNAAQLDTIEQADTSYAFSEKEEPLVHDIFEFRVNVIIAIKDPRPGALPDTRANNRLLYRDESGTIIGTEIVLGNQKPIRRPLSESDRAMTKATRRRGACDTCRLNKKRCNRPDDPTYECCLNCTKSKVLSFPCFMARIVDAQLFRDKPSPKHPRSSLRQAIFGSLIDIVRDSARQRPIIVTLTQDLGLEMPIVLARYEPEPGESTHRTWKKDGQARRIQLPPYCIASIRDTQEAMLEYITNFRSAFLKQVLGRSNEITRGLFDQAQRFATFNPDSTVSKALDLCAASRIIERDWRICRGPSDLGIPLVSDDPSNPFYDVVPITPMMDAQLDQIVIHSFLIPTRDGLLRSLQENMTSPNSTSAFFEIFLTIAVLLSHGEWLLSHSRQNALRVGSKTRYNHNPRAEGYFHACNTLIAYWHYMCRGASLADLNWKKESIRKWANLDLEQADYLSELQRKITQLDSMAMMTRLRDEDRYEEELYWCHQLFFPKWKATARSVKEITTI